MNNWKEIQLRDISSSISYGYTASASSENVGPKFLRITDITSGRIIWEDVPYCQISEKDFKKYQLGIGDIVIARTGATTGFNAVIKNEITSVFASYLIRFQIDNKIADPFFIAYILQSNNFQDYVDAIAGGSAQPGANAQQFADYEFQLPTLQEQKQISEILSSLDDKINLLHRQNKTLEQLAETLFRQWFVEDVKKSWERQSLGNFVEIKRGGSPRPIHDYISEAGLNWLKISDVTGVDSPFIYEIKEKIKEEGLSKTTFLKKGSLILSNSATPGIPKILDVDSCIHDGWLHFPKSKFSNQFLYLLFKYIRPELLQLGNGSIFTNLKTDILKEYVLPIPDDSSLHYFNEQVYPIFGKLYSNTNQIRTINNLRDTILPKLMSGEVRV